MRKVVHITSAHSARDTRIFLKESKSLAAAGYETIIVARHNRNETEGGVRIRAVCFGGDGRLRRMTLTAYNVYQAALGEKAGIYHLHDPELIPVGFALWLQGRRVVYDVHEDLPRQTLTKAWIPDQLRPVVSVVAEGAEWLASRLFSGVVAATPAIASRFTETGAPMALVQNFPIREEVAQSPPTKMEERPPHVVYIGGLRALRGAKEMVKAIDFVSNSAEAKLVIAGKFDSEQTESQLRNMNGWRHVHFRGWIDRSDIGKLLQRARAGLVLFHPAPNHVNAQPNKLFEYMAAGLPIIASDFPLWREIVEGAKCGLLVDPLNPAAIAEAIEWIFAHPDKAEAMGQRGREAVMAKYNWQAESEKLLSFYDELLP